MVDLAGRDGLRIRADVAGDPDAPPVLLLHGGGQTRHAWRGTLEALAARGWRAWSADLRGHGESEWAPDGDYRMEAFAGDVVALCEQLGRPAVVGASLGGLAAMMAIGERPDVEVASALVLVDVAPRVEPEGAHKITSFMSAHVDDGFESLEAVADAIQAFNPHRPRPADLSGLRKNLRQRDDGRWVWHWDPAYITGILGDPDESRRTRLDPGRLQAAARALTLPTLLVRGRMSDLLSEEGAREMLELAPHARYVDVAGAGHMVVGDRNDVFNDAVVAFLQSVRESA